MKTALPCRKKTNKKTRKKKKKPKQWQQQKLESTHQQTGQKNKKKTMVIKPGNDALHCWQRTLYIGWGEHFKTKEN